MYTPKTASEAISQLGEIAERAGEDLSIYGDDYNPSMFIGQVTDLTKRLTDLYAQTMKDHEKDIEEEVAVARANDLSEVVNWFSDDPSIKSLLASKNITLSRALSIIQDRVMTNTKVKDLLQRMYNRAWDMSTRIVKLFDAADSTNLLHGAERGMVLLMQESARHERNELEDYHIALRNEIDDRIPF